MHDIYFNIRFLYMGHVPWKLVIFLAYSITHSPTVKVHVHVHVAEDQVRRYARLKNPLQLLRWMVE